MEFDWSKQVGAGWGPLVKTAEYAVRTENGTIVQVKEKFGGLRIYAHRISKRVQEIISHLEDLSFTVCETCGDKGEPSQDGWIRTLCPSCREESKLKY